MFCVLMIGASGRNDSAALEERGPDTAWQLRSIAMRHEARLEPLREGSDAFRGALGTPETGGPRRVAHFRNRRERLLSRAAGLDEELRQKFLTRVPENARTLQLASEWGCDVEGRIAS
jgi:hypothetical protein